MNNLLNKLLGKATFFFFAKEDDLLGLSRKRGFESPGQGVHYLRLHYHCNHSNQNYLLCFGGSL